MVRHYSDEVGTMKVLNYVVLPCVMTHSVPTTVAFLKAILLELHQIMPFLNTIHFVTDSPSYQYRNRPICALVGRFPSLFGLRAGWAWLEAGHGKRPCDGVGGSALRSVETQFNILEVLEEAVARCQKQIEYLNGLLEAHAIVTMDNTLMIERHIMLP